ncbi:MAG TPA: tetratricopeptide repeat protein, partial [Ramlibacter sp.]|nr:tetratricopeptide repeat protein [Ramlibacter sp.]
MALFRKVLARFAGAGHPEIPQPPPVPDAPAVALGTSPETARAEQLIAEGNRLEDAGGLAEAMGLYQEAVRIAPELPRAHLNLGIAQEALADVAGARSCYQRVLALESEHPFGA